MTDAKGDLKRGNDGLYRCPVSTCDQLYEHSRDAMNCTMHIDWRGDLWTSVEIHVSTVHDATYCLYCHANGKRPGGLLNRR